MDLEKVLKQLRAELENLDAAIASLEHLQQRKPRRGRPPFWMADGKETRRPKSGGRRDPTVGEKKD